MAERSDLNLLNKLSDDDYFKEFVSQTVSKSLVLAIDEYVTNRPLTYTQKQQIANYRDEGVLNDIILGNFNKVSIMKLIEVFSVFNLGISISVIDKAQLAQETNPLTKH